MSISGSATGSGSVTGNSAYKPPRVELRPFDHRQFTSSLIDCWDALQRSSVDVASQPSLERNLFAFYDHCIFLATVHDADFLRKEAKDVDGQKNAKPKPQASHQSMLDIPGGTSSNTTNDATWTDLFGYNSCAVSSTSTNNTAQPSSDACPQHGIIVPTDRESAPIHPTTCAPTRSYDDDDLDMDGLLSNTPNTPAPDQSDLIGIAYLAPVTGTASVAHELSLGIALLPHARGRGFGTETLLKLVARAFDDFGCHRVSAGVLGPIDRPSLHTACSSAPECNGDAQGNEPKPQVDQSRTSVTKAETETILRMFVSMGFFVEGRRKRAVPDLIENGVWRDAHYLAILDTDWYNLQRRSQSLSRRTRWDEMLARHQSEREALASIESRLKKSTSVETLRPGDAVTSTTSVIASSAMSGSEGGQNQPIPDADSSVSSVVVAVSNPFRDPLLSQSALEPRTQTSSLSSGNSGQGDAEESEYGECISEHFSIKVENYLRAHPAPGPPPSDVDSNLDSDPEGGSESYSDRDEVENLETANGKGKARETIEHLMSEGDAQPLEASTSFLSDSQATDMSQRIWKKRRLSTASEASGAQRSMTSQVIANTRLEMDSGGLGLETESTPDSTMSWEAVSGGARSPSPSPSLSSYSSLASSQGGND